MVYTPSQKILPSEITPKDVWLNRRNLLAGAAGGMAATAMPGLVLAETEKTERAKLDVTKSEKYSGLEPTEYEYITGYNNFYEFGTGKEDPAANAHTLTTKPWSIKVDGLVNKPGDYALEDIIPAHPEALRCGHVVQPAC